MAVSSGVVLARAVFTLLGCMTLAVVIYTTVTDGSPFRRELLTPWMVVTLVDFYINVVAIAVWVVYKESSILSTVLWIVMLICFGSIATCAYVVMQLYKISSNDSSQYPFYSVLLQHSTGSGSERKCSCVLIGRISFSILGCMMLATILYTLLTDGSPFRKEIWTPWLVATLIDFYVNVSVISTWVAYKEQTWFSALLWIILLICLGSISTCTYIVVQLSKLRWDDPLRLMYVVESHGKQVRSTASE